MNVIGLMSGTSADGVDACLAEITGEGLALRATVIDAVTVPYPALIRQRLENLFREPVAPLRDLSALNVLVAEAFASAALAVCEKAGVPIDAVACVASHGQTVCHRPPGTGEVPATLQLGEGAVIAARTGVTVVSNFRPRDMAVGGQGAPLVPFADFILFSDPDRTRVIQNIGGIANLTYLRAGGGLDDVIAFDTGPGNMMIDALAVRATDGRLSCDLDGCLADAGAADEELLASLLEHPYFARPLPKSTGREVFGDHLTDQLWRGGLKRGLSAEDLVATATALTAESIARAYRDFLPEPSVRFAAPAPAHADSATTEESQSLVAESRLGLPAIDEVILCGGGADNPALVRMLRERLCRGATHPPCAEPNARPDKAGRGTRLLRTDEFGIPADAKEALSFAILGYATLQGTPNNVPSATGASEHVVLGQITPGAANANGNAPERPPFRYD